MKDNYIETLTNMGLSTNEAKIYLALLKKDISQVSEIVTLSGVPQKMIYYILQKLLNKGLCILIPGNVKRYKPTSPGFVIGNFIKQAQDNISLSKNMLVNLESQFLKRKKEISHLDFIEVIQNTKLIVKKMFFLESITKDEVLSFNKVPYVSTERNIEELRGLKKGIKYKSIYEVSEVSKLINRSVMEMYWEAGEEVRVTEYLPVKLMIFDSKTLLFVINEYKNSESDFTATIIQSSNIVNAQKELFYFYWNKSKTLEEFKNKYKGSISLEDR